MLLEQIDGISLQSVERALGNLLNALWAAIKATPPENLGQQARLDNFPQKLIPSPPIAYRDQQVPKPDSGSMLARSPNELHRSGHVFGRLQ